MYKQKEMDLSAQLLRLFGRMHGIKTLMETAPDSATIHDCLMKMIGMLEAAQVTGLICSECKAKILKDLESRHTWAWGNCPIDNEPENLPVGH
ncbi:Uncharacterised protein [Acetobacterium wieringae]|uniref:hypothetical protein n=1 Tax=Acetobacterium wieringae TaxID=52694 RepID=UPI001DCB81C2|nr:hypothetical protein [Acetobacterium wieringae]VUZ26583.1 Uncharacterised protein [Acetobacterium wieringae]